MTAQTFTDEELTTYRELGGEYSATAELLTTVIDRAESGALEGPML